MQLAHVVFAVATVAILFTVCGGPHAQADPLPDRIEAVRTFADNVLEHARDPYQGRPVFVDGLNVDTMEPVQWVCNEEVWVPSNLASHQNLFRTLVALTNLTGETKYRDAARDAMAWGFENLQHENGLMYWGGHRFLDLASGECVGEGYRHEFKHHYPFYEFMAEVDAERTKRFLEAFWNAHVLDWATMDMNRHGAYDAEMGELWANTFEGAEPFFEGRGLTFINCGSDLIYAGAIHHMLTGEEGGLEWGMRLAEQYVNARHPETGLGVYQFTKPIRRNEPPAEGPLPTGSNYGDRAENQFGADFGDAAREGYMIRSPGSIYGTNAVMQLQLAERLGEAGEQFVQWTVDGLRAWAEYGYDAENNLARPLLADGTDLTGYEIKRDGYYGSAGRVINTSTPPVNLIWSYALGYRLSGDATLWETARGMARGQDLGDIGSAPGVDVDVNLETGNSNPLVLFGVLEICRSSDEQAYRDLAVRIGENIVESRFHNGFFLPSAEHVNANVSATEPLALLALEAMLRGEPELVPHYTGGSGFFHGPHDGRGRTTDGSVLWNARR
ncbi:MAG: pectate lyase [Armatimonadota bacterium]|jgi:pectate lyase